MSAEAREGWYSFAERHGTNVTALLEAVGVELGKQAGRRTLPPLLQAVVRDAQAVASSRSSRRRL